jgi:ABC-type amino acid transport substrate-binding protein
MRRQSRIGIVLLCMTIFTVREGSVDAQGLSATPLIVGTKSAPPFAIKNADGSWQGISIELWRTIAAELGLAYELRELDLEGLLQGVEQGTLDVAVAALTITAAREKGVDFTHPFHTAGLGIAVAAGAKRPWWSVVRQVFSRRFLEIIAVLTVLLFVVGALAWLVERKRNAQQFGDGVTRGLVSGFWWAAVTMTTVGYGDKAPVTFGGRLIALIWMFAGIIMISGFTAAITTALTVSQLGDAIQGPGDLARVQVGTIQGSSSEEYLQNRRLSYRTYPTPQAGLQALANRDIQALVYDAPLLRYLAATAFGGTVEVLATVFERQDYGIALQPNSALREPINRAMLEMIHRSAWEDVLYRYLGQRS